jgi:hypothetical protein
VPPQQQHLPFAIDNHSAGSGFRVHQAVLEVPAIGKFDVCNPYIKPIIDIQLPLWADLPLHDGALF